MLLGVYQHIAVALPLDYVFISVKNFGTSVWTITGRLTARSTDGSEKSFFVKVSQCDKPPVTGPSELIMTWIQVAYGESGRVMLRGEFESSKLIYGLTPDFLPEPFGFGRYKVPNPPTYFYLSEFVDMDVTTAPDPVEFTSKLTHLHKISRSPKGRFGFHVETCDGDRAHVIEWQDSWVILYRNLFLGVCELDLKRNEPWPEYERAIKQVADKVIPRLLEPLKSRLLNSTIAIG